MKTKNIKLSVLAMLVYGSCSTFSHAEEPQKAESTALKPVLRCENLAGRSYYNIQVISAELKPATGAVPEYCKVSGIENGTRHIIEVRLPDEWKRRLVQQGGGGFDGRIPPVGKENIALNESAVQVVNNGGHEDPSGQALLNDPLAQQRYAYSAILTANKFAKSIAKAYYGEETQYAYYDGCSNGGRGALNAADKYGDEFDGVIAGAATRNMTGQVEQWTRASKLSLPDPHKLEAVYQVAVQKCDTLDGVKDGIISNWEACHFDPTQDVPASIGLSADEARSLKVLMTDIRLPDGQIVYSGIGMGDLAAWGDRYASLGVGYIRNIALNDPHWNPKNFDEASYYLKLNKLLEDKYQFSATKAGLIQFLNNNKKIIMWHGSDDTLVSHRDSIRAWQELNPDPKKQVFPLYIASGVNHCAGGPGADKFNLLTPMMQWVEKGIKPGVITASKVSDNGKTLFTRPMCQYPEYPRYNGSGDSTDSRNFTCVRN